MSDEVNGRRWRTVVVVGVVVVLGLVALFLVVPWALDSESDSVSGRVVSVEPAGSLARVCVTDGHGRTLCGEIAPSRLVDAGTTIAVGQCARIKVARGAALELERQECQ